MRAKYTYGFDLAPEGSASQSTLVIIRDNVVMAELRGLEAETVAALIEYIKQKHFEQMEKVRKLLPNVGCPGGEDCKCFE